MIIGQGERKKYRFCFEEIGKMLWEGDWMDKREVVFLTKGNRENPSLHFYFSGKERCAPRHSFGPAVRSQYLLHFVAQGQGVYTVCGREFTVQAGEVFLIYPGDVTFYRADEKEPWEYRWMAFHGNEAEAIMKRCGFTREHPVADYAQGSEQKKARVEMLLEALLEQYAGKNEGEYGWKGYLYLIFHELEQPERPEEDWKWEYVERAKKYISENFSYDLKIQDVAAYVGVDRTYLYRLFQKYQAQSPQDYLLGTRFQEARNMLRYTQMPVTLIACSCGFKDSATFCRYFKKRYGKSPRDYRREKQVNI